MLITDLKINDVVVTGDSYGYYLVRVVKEPYEINSDNYSKGYIQVDVECVKTSIPNSLGGVPTSPFCPRFWKLEEWLAWIPPELRYEKIKHLNLA